MNLRMNKQRSFRKNTLVRIVSIAALILGLAFSADNALKFFHGFYAYSAYDNRKIAGNPSQTAGNGTAASIQETGLTIPAASQKPDTGIIKTGEIPDLYPLSPETGEEIGELEIPKLKVTLPIYEGTNEEELEKGVGHYPGSVLPGENDNTVLSGHRDTVFRKLGEVGEGDWLIVRTLAGEFKYRVKKVRIVDKDDRTVIVPKPSATLTVTTCYPFEYIGSAPKRYILVAYLASRKLNQ